MKGRDLNEAEFTYEISDDIEVYEEEYDIEELEDEDLEEDEQ